MPRKYGTAFAYLRDLNKFPVACLAIQTEENVPEAKVQFAVYNPHDVFNRKKAREIATGRLAKHPLVITLPEPGVHQSVIIEAFVDMLKKESHLPSRLKEAIYNHKPFVPVQKPIEEVLEIQA